MPRFSAVKAKLKMIDLKFVGINDLDERPTGYNAHVRILIVRKGNKSATVI